jgi:sterol desaturase/sphingolipid hydroxylase (fatty acid hydroxylase superfamily)
MTAQSLEERVAALEAEVARLKQNCTYGAEQRKPWWDKVFGTFAHSEEFDEAMRMACEGSPRFWNRAADRGLCRSETTSLELL